MVIISLLGWSIVSTQVIGAGKTQGSSSDVNSKGISLNITDLKISQDRLDLQYEVRNDSEHEIWLCDDVDVNTPIDFETITSIDGSTLAIRLRLGVPIGWWCFEPPRAKYVRLMPREHRRASIWLTVPVRQQPVFAGRSAHHPEELKKARRLVLEVGYLEGNLRERTGKLVDEARRAVAEQQKEVEHLMEKENELLDQQGQLEKALETATEEAAKRHLMDKLEKLQAEKEKVDDAWGSIDHLSLYLEDLHLKVSIELLTIFEWIESNFKRGGDELVIPYEYCAEVERERFLRTGAEDIIVPYLPPRYLDLKNGLPWGRGESGHSP